MSRFNINNVLDVLKMFKKKKEKINLVTQAHSYIILTSQFLPFNQQTWQQLHLICYKNCLELGTLQIHFVPW